MGEKVYLSSPNVESVDELFETFKSLPGRSDYTRDDFFEFMTVDSPDRQSFLNTYCRYDLVPVRNSYVLKVEPK